MLQKHLINIILDIEQLILHRLLDTACFVNFILYRLLKLAKFLVELMRVYKIDFHFLDLFLDRRFNLEILLLADYAIQLDFDCLNQIRFVTVFDVDQVL